MQVIYVSYLAGNHDPEMLEGLSQKIVSNNKNNSVTGILFYHGGVFIEVLEGLRKDMAVLMPKIEKDPRHSGFQLIHCGKTKERSFDNFSWKLDAASSVDVHFFNEILKLKSENSQQDVSRWMNLITKVAS